MEQGLEVKVEETSEQVKGASQGHDGQPMELFHGGHGQAFLLPHMREGRCDSWRHVGDEKDSEVGTGSHPL